MLEAWADLPADSVQSARSLIDAAQLGVTEECATQELLERSALLGLVETTPAGFKPRDGVHERFLHLAFAFYAVEHYRSSVHRDATEAQVVLTKPPRPSVLEQKLSVLGWRTTELEPTEHAFHNMVRAARRRVVVMTTFLDYTGEAWLQDLLSYVTPGVERMLILRSLEDNTRKDYPFGFDALCRCSRHRAFGYSTTRFRA
ncbi:MAG: hypothetical protein MO853_00865 [Candidatus Protistobacter heckmanni]|nr:hypothetical protein [Candidatus Protistobacter heckmanni]